MKHQRGPKRHDRNVSLRKSACRGFSLIELMVSMTIGLVIVVAALSAYSGAASANKMAEAQSVMNEDGQAALGILSQQIRMAGYYTSEKLDDAIRGCDGTFTNVADSNIEIGALPCTTNDASSDSVAVRYEADKYNTIESGNSKPTDCLGNDLIDDKSDRSAEKKYYAENLIYLAIPTGRTSKSLYCKGKAADTSQALVENVEDFQLMYGLAGGKNGQVVASYVKASDISDWERVLTVRLCVVIKSDRPVLSDIKSSPYKNCNGTRTDPKDLYLRHAYNTSVVLRNRLL